MAGEIALSGIEIGKDGKITVLSGPLLQVRDSVRRINLHRRVAEAETELMGEKRLLHLGVELRNV